MKKYEIFQLRRDCPNYRMKSFAPLRWLGDTKPDINDYKKMYEGTLEGDNDLAICEKVFEIFNLHHPSDFKGHSLSVADIVVVDGVKYYCDSWGFEEVA